MAVVQTARGRYFAQVGLRVLCVGLWMTLCSDFLAYCMFAFSCFRVPEGLAFTVHVMR